MKNLLRTELCKAFRNGYFLASLALGILFVALSAWYEISLYHSDIGFLQQVRTVEEMGYVKYPLVPMSILYNSWIGGECVSVGYTLFFTLLPLLAVLPYGRSFSQEQKNGYLKVIIPRCGRTRYFASKWVATFLSGGVAVVLPLLVSLGICALVFPAVKPNVIYNQYFAFGHESMGSALFHTHPLVYTLLYLGIDFVFSGLFACLSLTTAFFLPAASGAFGGPLPASHRGGSAADLFPLYQLCGGIPPAADASHACGECHKSRGFAGVAACIYCLECSHCLCQGEAL